LTEPEVVFERVFDAAVRPTDYATQEASPPD